MIFGVRKYDIKPRSHKKIQLYKTGRFDYMKLKKKKGPHGKNHQKQSQKTNDKTGEKVFEGNFLQITRTAKI